MRATHRLAFAALLVGGLMLVPHAGEAISIDFESFSDGDNPSGSGVTFTNAMVIVAGISLNELEFPPHSPNNVAFDDGGPMVLTFSSPFAKVSGFFTYTTPITLLAFDGPDGTGNQIGSATSVFAANFVSSGNPPNEMIMIAALGIESLTIAGDQAGNSFVLDDFTGTAAAVPEPATLLLCGGGLIGLWGQRLRGWRRPSL